MFRMRPESWRSGGLRKASRTAEKAGDEPTEVSSSSVQVSMSVNPYRSRSGRRLVVLGTSDLEEQRASVDE